LEFAILSKIPGFDRDRRILLTEADDLDKAADELTASNLDEICWSLCFMPSFLASLFYSGFLSVASNLGSHDDPIWVLLPKLHAQRCICRPQEVHVSRKTRKQLCKFKLTLDTNFEAVADGINRQHRESWLYPPLLNALRALQGEGGLSRVVSVELWSLETGKLAAGELGVLVGAVYTSLTAFFDKSRYSGAGKVQLAALSDLLRNCGVQVWDLGMELDYKTEMGAMTVPRGEFLRLFRSSRSSNLNFNKLD